MTETMGSRIRVRRTGTGMRTGMRAVETASLR